MDILQPQTEDTTSLPDPNHSIPASPDGHLQPLRGYFNMQNPSGQDLDALNYIYKFYDSKVRSIPEMLLAIRNIEQKIGMAALGENRLQQVYKYIRIDAQIAELNMTKESMQHG